MAFNDSDVVSASLDLLGVWLHDPDDPAGTSRQYLYHGGSRQEEGTVKADQLQFAGRTYPVTEFGDTSEQSVSVTFVIPWDDDYEVAVENFRNFVSQRKLVCYRDVRGRKVFGTVSAFTVSDVKLGTLVSFTVARNDYEEAV